MFPSTSSIVSVLFALALFSQDVDAGMSRRRHVPGRAGLHAYKARRAPAVMVRSVESDQSSLELNPSQIGSNIALDGQNPPVAGQVPSLTSTNNYINFCESQNVPLTNGTQLKTGSCNQTPMGRIIATTQMPSGKFSFPFNGVALKTNSSFTIKLNLRNLNAGHFSNPTVTYYANPQTVGDDGVVIGHTHVVMESIPSYTATDLPKPTNFAFFKGVDGAADGNGQVTVDVTGGLPKGFYKLSSINAAATHQPVLVAVAQHGSLDDSIFFEVNDQGVATVDINAGADNVVDAVASATASASVADVSATEAVTDSVAATESVDLSTSAAATATDSVVTDSAALETASAAAESSAAAATETASAASETESATASVETASASESVASDSAEATATSSAADAAATGDSQQAFGNNNSKGGKSGNGKDSENQRGNGNGGRN